MSSRPQNRPCDKYPNRKLMCWHLLQKLPKSRVCGAMRARYGSPMNRKYIDLMHESSNQARTHMHSYVCLFDRFICKLRCIQSQESKKEKTVINGGRNWLIHTYVTIGWLRLSDDWQRSLCLFGCFFLLYDQAIGVKLNSYMIIHIWVNIYYARTVQYQPDAAQLILHLLVSENDCSWCTNVKRAPRKSKQLKR